MKVDLSACIRHERVCFFEVVYEFMEVRQRAPAAGKVGALWEGMCDSLVKNQLGDVRIRARGRVCNAGTCPSRHGRAMLFLCGHVNENTASGSFNNVRDAIFQTYWWVSSIMSTRLLGRGTG